MELVGVSGDSAATHQLFKTAYGLKHTLLADPEGVLAKQFGLSVQKGTRVRSADTDGQPLLDAASKSIIVERGVTLPRWTLIVGKDGKLLSKRTQVNPATDADEVAKLVEAAKYGCSDRSRIRQNSELLTAEFGHRFRQLRLVKRPSPLPSNGATMALISASGLPLAAAISAKLSVPLLSVSCLASCSLDVAARSAGCSLDAAAWTETIVPITRPRSFSRSWAALRPFRARAARWRPTSRSVVCSPY